MRGAIVAVVACGCSFGGSAAPIPDAPAYLEVVDDTAADFSGQLSGGVVAARGALEPDTFVMGGLHALGFRQPNNVEAITKTTSLDSLPPLGTSTGEVYGFLPSQLWPGSGPTFPKGLGINQGDFFALVLDGEIFLTQGATMLQLKADDAAVFEIDAGDPTVFGTDVGSGLVTATVTAPTDGWYPIRGAMGEGQGDASLQLATLDDVTSVPIDGARLRARTTAAPGLVMQVFGLPELELGPNLGYDPGPLDHPMLAPGPSDYGFMSSFSIRYEGQFLVDQPASYFVNVDIGPDRDDGYRLFVDGKLYALHWLGMPDLAPAVIELAAGWHALVIDYGDNGGNASIQLALATADHVLLGPVAADHLRPVVTEGTVCALGTSSVAVLGAGATINYPISALAPTGAVTDFVDVIYTLSNGRAHFAATLTAGGTSDPVVIHTAANETDTGSQYDYDPDHTAFHGVPASGPWQLAIGDSLVNENPTFTGELVISHHGGVLAPFSPALDYVSMPRELDATLLGPIHALGDLAGATLVLQVRTSDDPIAIAQEPWIDVDNGAIPTAAARRYFQYHVAISDDGWSFPVIEEVTIDFTH